MVVAVMTTKGWSANLLLCILKWLLSFFIYILHPFYWILQEKTIAREVKKKILACVSKLKITKRENSGKIIRISEKNNIAERSLN